MILDYVVTAVLAVAVVLQLAVDHAPDIKDSRDSHSARRVLICGMFLILLSMIMTCYRGDPANPIIAVGVGLIALAEIAFALSRLFPDLMQLLHHHSAPPAKHARAHHRGR